MEAAEEKGEVGLTEEVQAEVDPAEEVDVDVVVEEEAGGAGPARVAWMTPSTNSASLLEICPPAGSCESLARSSSSLSLLTAIRPCLRRWSPAVIHSVKRIAPCSAPSECERSLKRCSGSGLRRSFWSGRSSSSKARRGPFGVPNGLPAGPVSIPNSLSEILLVVRCRFRMLNEGFSPEEPRVPELNDAEAAGLAAPEDWLLPSL